MADSSGGDSDNADEFRPGRGGAKAGARRVIQSSSEEEEGEDESPGVSDDDDDVSEDGAVPANNSGMFTITF